MELGVIAKVVDPMILYCDNSGVNAQAKEPRNHRKGKHIEKKVSPSSNDCVERRHYSRKDCI